MPVYRSHGSEPSIFEAITFVNEFSLVSCQTNMVCASVDMLYSDMSLQHADVQPSMSCSRR